MSDVTKLLLAVKAGDPAAADRLLSNVYDELNRLAVGQMAGEQPGRTLSATALVHEAYVRLVDRGGRMSFENRRHFFGAAARAMRRILVEAARRRGREKRGGGRMRVELPDVADPATDQRLLDLDRVLSELATRDALAAEVVELHHFAGRSHYEVAELLGISVYQARQKWTFARAWLRDAMN